MALRERQFGVEIECNMGNIISHRHPYVGLRHTVKARNVLVPEVKAGRIKPGWLRDIHPDGSGVEICSPRLSGSAGFAELKHVMSVLVANGGRADYRDGLHVHHNAPEFKGHSKAAIELRGRVVDSWANNETTINKLVAERRHNSHHCPRLTAGAVEIIKSGTLYGLSRYSLNMRAIEKHGSIEFRLHEGTLDFDQAKAWIRFGQAFIESCLTRKNPIKPVGVAELLRIVGTAETAQRRLMSRRGAR